MKPEIKQAFDLVTQATASVVATRETHIKLQKALELIEQELTPKPQE